MRRTEPAKSIVRCDWARTEQSTMYHDREWGVPLHDDTGLLEFLILEGAQAGLSWETILKKREHYRRVFLGFAPEKVARFTPAKVESLLLDPGIVRNRLKVESAVSNAQAFKKVQREFGSFDAYAWSFVDGQPLVNQWKELTEIPARTEVSDRLSRNLIQRGFRFVGSTICYAFMQAVGMVNDHVVACHRYRPLANPAARKRAR